MLRSYIVYKKVLWNDLPRPKSRNLIRSKDRDIRTEYRIYNITQK